MTSIYVTAGNAQYVGGTVTETSGADITGSTFTIGLSTSADVPPTTWSTPDVNTQGTTTADRVLKLLVDDSVTPGTYYCWARVTDSPEIEPVRLTSTITVI